MTKLSQRALRRWRSVSFRSGLVAAVTVGATVSLALLVVTTLAFLLFIATDGITQTSIVDRVEDQLLLGVAPQDLRVDLPDTSFGPDDAQETTSSFWAVLEGETILHSSGDVDQVVLDAPFTSDGFAIGIDDQSPARDRQQIGVKRLDGTEWLLVDRLVEVPAGPSYQVVAAAEGSFSIGGFLRDSLPALMVVVLVVMLVAGAITSFLTRRALRRVERIRSEVELITQQSLDRRVPTADAADGIDKLGHTMNDMLQRLETSNAQQTQFLADASHELRSPVTGLLAQLDVAATYPDRVDTATLLPKLRNEAKRLQDLVNDLLFLSRSEARATLPPPRPTITDVDALLTSEVEHQRLLHPDVGIVPAEPCGAMVQAESKDVARAVRNLVDNALRHCVRRVTLSTELSGSVATIAVSDDGPGVPAAEAERIFDRFVRLDEARSRDGGGSGLGLAIAREIARRYGGTITLDSITPNSAVEGVGEGGATFLLSLPLSSRPRE